MEVHVRTVVCTSPRDDFNNTWTIKEMYVAHFNVGINYDAENNKVNVVSVPVYEVNNRYSGTIEIRILNEDEKASIEDLYYSHKFFLIKSDFFKNVPM